MDHYEWVAEREKRELARWRLQAAYRRYPEKDLGNGLRAILLKDCVALADDTTNERVYLPVSEWDTLS